ncbi:unnamed protein product, partial [Mesorhabditis belari]|uniref:Uncharacterized protein n=1 Tax=Mesorhabditis belari TaxID=2138241 RepID=A0AAF3FMS3_9BILA
MNSLRYSFGQNGNVDKEEMLKYFESEERHKAGGDSPTTGYILSEIMGVANTSGYGLSATKLVWHPDSPSPLQLIHGLIGLPVK